MAEDPSSSASQGSSEASSSETSSEEASSESASDDEASPSSEGENQEEQGTSLPGDSSDSNKYSLPVDMQIQSQAIYLMNLDSGEVLQERNSQVFLPDIQSANVPVKSPIEVFERIWRGSYPEIATANPDTNMWSAFFQSYIQTYLMRDVRALTQISDEHKFYDFLQAVAARTGQMLNYSSLALDENISQPTAKSYLSILETSGIVKLLYPYSRNKILNMVSTPKIHMLDNGLAAFLTGWTSPEDLMNGAMTGAFFESWCVAEILKSYVNAGESPSFYYYRDKDKNEIDLVIEREGKIYPVEFKKAATISKADVKRFNKLSNFNMPVGTGALISLYPDAILIKENVKAIPAFAL